MKGQARKLTGKMHEILTVGVRWSSLQVCIWLGKFPSFGAKIDFANRCPPALCLPHHDLLTFISSVVSTAVLTYFPVKHLS